RGFTSFSPGHPAPWRPFFRTAIMASGRPASAGSAMILNAYAVLCAFVAGLELVAALLVLGLGVAAWRREGRPAAFASERHEEQSVLLYLSAGLLLLLSVASWPLLYLLL